MNYENLYSLINLAVIPAWLLLVLLPKVDITKRIVHSGIYPLAFGLFYTASLGRAVFMGEGNPNGDFSSIAGVMALFDHPNGILIGWSHYLVFDLFVGAWISRDALRRGMNHFVVVPCLLFTFMFGPIGLLMYITLRKLTGKGGLALQETAE